MAEFNELWPSGPVFAQAEHFKLGTDCVLLADFVNAGAAKRGVDLGCASGAIMLLLLARTEKLHMTGLELLPEAAALARENMAANGLGERSEIICGDIRRVREVLPAGGFDLVAANPPYYPAKSGAVSPDAKRAGARGELECTLEDICAAAKWLLRTGGALTLVHKPERLSKVFCTMSAHGIEPKRLRCVHARSDSAPSLVLIEGRRGGKPGLSFLPPLILADADGSESAEYKRIYHR